MESLARDIARVIDATEPAREPCDHVQLSNVFPDDVFEAMLHHLPERRFYIDQKHYDALRADGRSTRTRIIMLPQIIAGLPRDQRKFWSDIVRALRSPLVAAAFKRKFAPALSARFGCPATDVAMIPNIMLLRDLPGYKIGVHNDSWRKVITVQFYLPNDDARAHLGTQFFERATTGDTLVKTMPFVRNSGYAFPVTQNSWHGVGQLAEHEAPRDSLMLVYDAKLNLGRRIHAEIRNVGQVIRARSVAFSRRH